MKTEHLDIETRLAGPDDSGSVEGYAAVFNAACAYGDVIQPGAFAKTLAEHKAAGTSPLMFWQHNPDEPIGVWTDLTEDARGLRVKGRIITDTSRGRDVHALIRAGAVRGLSIGFRTRKAEQRPSGGRVLKDVQLVEISPVSLPAQRRAQVTGIKSEPVAAGLAADIRRCAARLKGKAK